MSANRRAPILSMIFLVSASLAHAHKPSDSYLTLTPNDTRIDVRWDVALRDLDNELGLDANDDGALSWGEVRSRHRDIEAFLLPQLHVNSGPERCEIAGNADKPRVVHRLDTHSDGTYAVLTYSLDCTAQPHAIEVEYRLFATTDPTHRGILRIDTAGFAGTAEGDAAGQTAVLGPDRPTRKFELSRPSWPETLAEFVKQGVWHIWIGFDHILFLLALLLTCVLVRAEAGGKSVWQGVPRLRPALLDVVKIVTAFTLAHSITLTLAVLGVVSLPSRLVESAIALTVMLAGINNLMPVLRERRWVAAFGFGLIHGFGFAGVLKDLGLPPDALALSLFGFNLGVEIGQLGIVSIFFPLAYMLRFTAFYRRGVLGAGSLAIIALALIWLLERALDLKLFGAW